MLVVIIVIILVGISLAYQSISWWNQKRAFQEEAAVQAYYVAESAANQYINWLNSPASASANPSATGKTFLNGGFYWIPAANLVTIGSTSEVTAGVTESTNYISFQVAAKFNGITRRLDVMVSRSSSGAFERVIDAEAQKGGTTQIDFGSGDVIRGNAYINGNVNAQGTAQLLDTSGKTGNITKYTGDNLSNLTGPNSPTFTKGPENPMDLSLDPNGLSRWENRAAANRSTPKHLDKNGNKYIDVKNELTTKGVTNKWKDGSTATDILDVNNPAHIFRKDPGSTNGQPDRTSVYEWAAGKTAKSDFYLEDPTSSNVTQTSLNGTNHPVNGDVTASMINITDDGNNAVYFIDGNMRVSGEPVKSYQLSPDPASVKDPLRMSFVVKGNVSLTDNLLLPKWMSKTDGVAIIAIEDPAYPNVDPSAFAAGGGTTKLTPLGVSVDEFVAAYNAKAKAAGNARLNFTPLDLSNPADQARAAQEYNKIYGSGNVFFGDPGSGTVEHFESFLFAQNNFYATNLDSTKASGGTDKLEIYGNMAAGNQVLINRNTKTAGYIPLNLTFDPLIATGGNLPDLPRPKTSSDQPWTILSWKQSSNTAETGGDVQ
jgi:type II secretory pathway pseudopilin PulG